MGRVALVLVGSRSVNKRSCRFVESLGSAGFDPVVLAVPRRQWGTSGMEVPALVARRGFMTLRSAGSHSGRRQRPDIVVCMHWLLLPVAVLLKFGFRAQLIYDEHDHYEMLALEAPGPIWMNRVRSWLVRRVHALFLPRVDVVTCIRLADGMLKRHLQRWATTVVELHNYPSRRWGVSGRDRPPSNGSVAIVYIGGIWREKGCRVMLDAFLRLADDPSLSPLTLHAFGRGDPEIERLLASSQGVTFHGSSAPDDIVNFLSSHDCVGLVLLEDTPRYSLYSTNCHKLFEYLASGAPVLATDVGENADILATLDGGWTIDPAFDVEVLATTLRQIVAEPDELRRRGDMAAAAVERHDLWWEGEWQKVPLSRGDHV